MEVYHFGVATLCLTLFELLFSSHTMDSNQAFFSFHSSQSLLTSSLPQINSFCFSFLKKAAKPSLPFVGSRNVCAGDLG
uniref:Secreted protein n=1 Tax=Mus musculus TaxID=10090 RepID=Q6R5G6_MOUSE|nr:unknown [Mus musculus]